MFDFDNILVLFQQFTGCGNRAVDVMPIVHAAVKKLETQLDTSRVTDDDIRRCEYAAAWLAVYDYFCFDATKEKFTVTEDGTARTGSTAAAAQAEKNISAALKAKNSAMELVSDLLKSPDAFMFAAIGGNNEL